MAYRCILDGRKECNGCGECEESEEDEENKVLTAQQIGDSKKEQELYEKGLI